MSPMFLGGLTARAMKLKSKCQNYDFYEAYPGAVAKQLELNQWNYKKDLESIPQCKKVLEDRIGLEITPINSWHQFDAVLAFYIGWKCVRGEAEAIGDEQEGVIYI